MLYSITPHLSMDLLNPLLPDILDFNRPMLRNHTCRFGHHRRPSTHNLISIFPQVCNTGMSCYSRHHRVPLLRLPDAGLCLSMVHTLILFLQRISSLDSAQRLALSGLRI